ncbi:MAG: gluconeogenesis factor YvcK family protein, partial [archaeon]
MKKGMKKRKLKIVTLGGGGGHAQLLKGIKNIPNLDITALCNCSDSGGSTGILRREFKKYGINGYLGDLTKCICALSKNNKLSESMMLRLNSDTLQLHSVKNILFTSLAVKHGVMDAIKLMQETMQLDKNHRAYPVSLGRTSLKVKLKGKQTFSGETYVDTISRNRLWDPINHKITNVWLTPKISADRNALKAIKNADYIIFCPGDLFTSVIPVLLVSGIPRAIEKSKAKLIQVINITTKLGETDGYDVLDFVQEIKKRINGREPDYVVCNSGKISDSLLRRYKIREHKIAIPATESSKKILKNKLIQADVWTSTKNHYIIHDENKLTNVI